MYVCVCARARACVRACWWRVCVIEDDVQRAHACAQIHTQKYTPPPTHTHTQTQVTVIRNGADKVISCHDVVVGDIMKLSTGDIITADAYAIGANDLQISEKALTGETGTHALFVFFQGNVGRDRHTCPLLSLSLYGDFM